MKPSQKTMDAKVDIQVSALIDVVFLLLIYFMVTAALIRKEADLSFILPGPAPAEPGMPVEARVGIAANGAVELDGLRFSGEDRSLEGLAAQLAGLKKLAESQNAEFSVDIVPHADALHQRVVDVMNACAAAGVERLAFGKSI